MVKRWELKGNNTLLRKRRNKRIKKIREEEREID